MNGTKYAEQEFRRATHRIAESADMAPGSAALFLFEGYCHSPGQQRAYVRALIGELLALRERAQPGAYRVDVRVDGGVSTVPRGAFLGTSTDMGASAS